MSSGDGPQSPGGPPRLICRCIGVSSRRIATAILDQDLSRREQIQEAVRAGTGCGTCHPEIDEILADLRGEPVDRLTRMQNRMLCQQETRQRVESSLYNGIVPKLPAGSEVEVVSVDGLRVELHLEPAEDAALRTLIAQKLQKLVCSELEIVYS